MIHHNRCFLVCKVDFKDCRSNPTRESENFGVTVVIPFFFTKKAPNSKVEGS
jgi:hypothetical protein